MKSIYVSALRFQKIEKKEQDMLFNELILELNEYTPGINNGIDSFSNADDSIRTEFYSFALETLKTHEKNNIELISLKNEVLLNKIESNKINQKINEKLEFIQKSQIKQSDTLETIKNSINTLFDKVSQIFPRLDILENKLSSVDEKLNNIQTEINDAGIHIKALKSDLSYVISAKPVTKDEIKQDRVVFANNLVNHLVFNDFCSIAITDMCLLERYTDGIITKKETERMLEYPEFSAVVDKYQDECIEKMILQAKNAIIDAIKVELKGDKNRTLSSYEIKNIVDAVRLDDIELNIQDKVKSLAAQRINTFQEKQLTESIKTDIDAEIKAVSKQIDEQREKLSKKGFLGKLAVAFDEGISNKFEFNNDGLKVLFKLSSLISLGMHFADEKKNEFIESTFGKDVSESLVLFEKKEKAVEEMQRYVDASPTAITKMQKHLLANGFRFNDYPVTMTLHKAFAKAESVLEHERFDFNTPSKEDLEDAFIVMKKLSALSHGEASDYLMGKRDYILAEKRKVANYIGQHSELISVVINERGASLMGAQIDNNAPRWNLH
jgi:hypothetical protein